MKNEPTRSLPGQVVLGTITLVMGVLFLLDNLDLWDFRFSLHFWPVVFIVFGLLKMNQSRTPAGMAIGGGLVLLGLIVILNRLGYIYLSWRAMWPLVLIAVGASVIAKALQGRKRIEGPAMPDGIKGDDSILDVTAILGGYQRRVTTDDFRGGEITAIMGGCELDLRESKIQSEAVINVFAVCGGITIKVPPDWSVVLLGTPILGGFDEKTISPPDTSKRLFVRGYAIMGGLEVRN